MNDVDPPFDESELSAEDLAILRAFDSMEDWQPASSTPPLSGTTPHGASSTSLPDEYDERSSDEMLLLFVSEVEEDLARMRTALLQLDQEDQIDPARFVALKRVAHKVRGTAGALDYHNMATIAHDIELIVQQITEGQLFPLMGVNGLIKAVEALELSLQNITMDGKEGDAPLVDLEVALAALNIPLQPTEPDMVSAPLPSIADDGLASIPSQLLSTLSPAFIRVDPRRVEHLIQDSELLAELRPPLENAQAEVTIALQELFAAQERLRQLQSMLSSLFSPNHSPLMLAEPTFSSLIARILNEPGQRNDFLRKNRSQPHSSRAADPSLWDELDIEHYNEKDLLFRALNEAISDVLLASARVPASFAPLNTRLQEYIAQASEVRSDALLLRLAPLSILIPRLERAISAMAQVDFEVRGEDTEVDQDILELLATPLLQMVRTCIADTFSSQDMGKQPFRIWLSAHGIGNEITIEIGFSMTVRGGALEIIREPIQRLNGAYSLQRNASGGVSFYLRFPRSHGTSLCLLVRSGTQHLIVPFSQVQRIGDSAREQLDFFYNLRELLGFPEDSTTPPRLQPVLILPREAPSRALAGVAVDEVLDAVELVVKPLKSYMQRPGITGAAIDGNGSVLLMLDLFELVRTSPAPPQPGQAQRQMRILVADDSVSLRQSLVQTLSRANYRAMEARDGMEALEQLLQTTPDLFLLDVEMPNLNGYDLLSIMGLYPELASVKIVMLTSRSSERHRQRAHELGAHAYLTKPCDQDTLLATIQRLLTS